MSYTIEKLNSKETKGIAAERKGSRYAEIYSAVASLADGESLVIEVAKDEMKKVRGSIASWMWRTASKGLTLRMVSETKFAIIRLPA